MDRLIPAGTGMEYEPRRPRGWLVLGGLVRNPLSPKKLVHLDGQRAVLYRSKLNRCLGRNFEAMDPVEWLARMSDRTFPRLSCGCPKQ